MGGSGAFVGEDADLSGANANFEVGAKSDGGDGAGSGAETDVVGGEGGGFDFAVAVGDAEGVEFGRGQADEGGGALSAAEEPAAGDADVDAEGFAGAVDVDFGGRFARGSGDAWGLVLGAGADGELTGGVVDLEVVDAIEGREGVSVRVVSVVVGSGSWGRRARAASR